MNERIIKHYDPPIPFEKFVPVVASTAKPKNISNAAKRVTTMVDYGNDISRGPYRLMLDEMARARQAITGESYAKAFTETYTDPANVEIRNGALHDHLAKGHDAIHGTRLSLIPAQKAAAPSYDPIAKQAETAKHLGPNHARLHSLAVDHMRAHAGMSYESAYSHLYSRPENVSLRNAVKAEHMKATMAGYGDGLGKAAPADPKQDDVSPGSANYDLHRLVVTRMKNNPKLSYEQAFTHEYLAPENRGLKERVTAEGVLHMQHLAPAKPFPAYGDPGDRTHVNVGRSGAKPVGYVGG
jgi:hypothetical protein